MTFKNSYLLESMYFPFRSDRRISVISGDEPDPMTPSTLRRSVSAFGEITVMPVGDNEDDDLRISVDEEIGRY